MTEPILNQDPIEVITQRMLPDGTLEAQLRLSQRDWDRLLGNPRDTRYSIGPSLPAGWRPLSELPMVDGVSLDGGPVGEAAEMGKDIERAVGFGDHDVTVVFKHMRLGALSDEHVRALYETTPPGPERCTMHTGDDTGSRLFQCVLPEGHKGGHTFESDHREPVLHDLEDVAQEFGVDLEDDPAPPRTTTCGATTVFWPDMEACDATCHLPKGHEPADVHEDDILGGWHEDDLLTNHPYSED